MSLSYPSAELECGLKMRISWLDIQTAYLIEGFIPSVTVEVFEMTARYVRSAATTFPKPSDDNRVAHVGPRRGGPIA